MVHPSQISSGSGDDGSTGLGDGSRCSKADPLIAALGAVDELNALLGLILSQGHCPAWHEALQLIQHDLFDLGADLACPPATQAGSATPRADRIPRILPEQVARLDNWNTALGRELNPLHSFILPGGSPAAAWLHLARCVCRRAERDLVACGLPPGPALHYLNRLSDLCFQLARHANAGTAPEIHWRPGAGRDPLPPAPQLC